jgi:hypothetical protein
LPAIRVGTRVRCTDDRVEGRITWANAVSVKIKWDDGEQVTWKRAELATKPIEFLDAEQAEPEQPHAEPVPEQPTAPEATVSDQEVAAPPPAEQAAPTEVPVAQEPVVAPPVAEPVARPEAVPAETGPGQPINTELPGGFAIKKRQRKPKTTAEPKEKKLSAIDAAAKVLAETGQAMSCKEMIGTMAAKGYWISPGGKTPDATLASAILREIAVKGEQSRFVKTGPGRFGLQPMA